MLDLCKFLSSQTSVSWCISENNFMLTYSVTLGITDHLGTNAWLTLPMIAEAGTNPQ